MLNGGKWNGKQLLDESYVKTAGEKHVMMGERKYGYLWWVQEYPFRNHTVRAFMAAGNGGQIVMVFPEYNVVFGSFGGNYADASTFVMQRDLVPKYVLPMILDSKSK